MRQPEPNRDSEAFLSALAEQLSTPPGDLATNRHIAEAVAAVRAARPAGRSMQWAAAAMAFVALFGTGGIAVAGGLPTPVQGMVADVARALPLPFEIPYPDSRYDEGDAALRAPEDGEVEIEVLEPTAPPPEPVLESSSVVEAQRSPHAEADEQRGDQGDVCDVDDLSNDRGGLDDDERRESMEQLGERCGLDFVAPPNFTDGHRDQRDDRDEDMSRDDRDDERGQESRDRGFDEDEGRGSDRSEERDGDGQEGRHHDGDRDDDRGPGGRWDDGRDRGTRDQGEDRP